MKIIIQSILYLFGLEENPIKKYDEVSDEDAIRNDWQVVGMDIRNAMNNYASKQ